jgi:hypothetical protein
MFWDAGVPMPWGDVHLPHGWHLSPDRVPVPPIPASGRARVAEIRRRRAQLPADLQQDPAYGDASPNWDLWFEVEHDARRHTCFTSATARPRAQPRTPARRAGRRPGGLYIGEQPQAPHQPQAQAEEDDPELQAALAASREQSDLDELAKWPHLAETLRASALEEAARKAQEDAQAEAWAFLELARRQEEATRQAALREEEERRAARLAEEERLATLRLQAELQAAAEEQLRGESARRARLRRPASPPNPDSAWERAQWSPWPESPVPSGVSSRNSASPPGGRRRHRRRRRRVLLGVVLPAATACSQTLARVCFFLV